MIETKGTSHNPLFVIEVQVKDEATATAEGKSKSLAAQAAAQALLDQLGIEIS